MRPVVEAVEPRRLLAATVHLTTRYADGNFLPANWSITTGTTTTGGTQSAQRVATGGHPGGYRRLTNTVNSAAAGQIASVFGLNVFKKANFNPALKGSIASISYSEDSKLLVGSGQGQATGVGLLQNGVLYIDYALLTPKSTWVHQKRVNLKAANFITLDGSHHPDFSQSAAPIQFGFFRANGTGVGGGGYYTAGAIDNFALTIKSTRVTANK